jgi:hypothetical protein
MERLKAAGHDLPMLVINTDTDQAWEKDAGDWQPVASVWQDNIETTKVLVFTPAHPGYGIKPQTYASIQAAIAAYDGPVDWLISRNDNPYMQPYENVTHQHNKARAMVLAGGYDALLSIEADMIVPPDTIGRLIEADADIAYGLYVWRHSQARWSAYEELGLWGGKSVSLAMDGSGVRESWGRIIDVAGIGMGCTLIYSDVLEAIKFRLHDGEPGWIEEEFGDDFARLRIDPRQERKHMVCDDWLFSMDAQHHDFIQRNNLNVVCGHIDNDTVLWPDPEAAGFVRTEPLVAPVGA